MKKYLANEFDSREYNQWLGGRKVFIQAPTGSGKTTFILKTFLPYCSCLHKKVLILCNRRLLKVQYLYDLAEQYKRYIQMTDDVDVLTYQALSEEVKKVGNCEKILNAYDVIVCDEAHFFYSDSDFNAWGTYALLQALVLAAYFKTLIFISATFEPVKPLIENTFARCKKYLIDKNGGLKNYSKWSEYNYEIIEYDFNHWADFSRFSCYFAEDEETLLKEIADSSKKTLIFIDDREKAEAIKKKVMSIGKLSSNDIFILNSQILDEQPDHQVIQKLALCHKIEPKILITTSVLDNGVSIHDEDVGNVIIATESKVSFLQMLGRIRSESINSCKLFIFPHKKSHYEKRVRQYEEKMKLVDSCKELLKKNEFEVLVNGWSGNNDCASMIRNFVIITKRNIGYYHPMANNGVIISNSGEHMLAINDFNIEKSGNMLHIEKTFLKLFLDSPVKIAETQISWIAKNKDELNVIKSTYKMEREEILKKELLKIKDYTLEELRKTKKYLAKEYRNDILEDFIKKNDSFATEILDEICKRFDLVLKRSQGADGKKRYTVEPEVADEEKCTDC